MRETIRDRLSPRLAELAPMLFRPDGSESWRDACGEFYVIMHDVLFGYALRCLSDPEVAEDIVQQTFERVIIRLGKTDKGPIENLYSYCFVVMKHIMVDHWIKEGSNKQADGALDDRKLSLDRRQRLSGGHRKGEGAKLRADLRIDLDWALGELSFWDRELLFLFYLNGLSAKEICQRHPERFSTSNAVAQALYRARVRAKAIMEEQGLTRDD